MRKRTAMTFPNRLCRLLDAHSRRRAAHPPRSVASLWTANREPRVSTRRRICRVSLMLVLLHKWKHFFALWWSSSFWRGGSQGSGVTSYNHYLLPTNKDMFNIQIRAFLITPLPTCDGMPATLITAVIFVCTWLQCVLKLFIIWKQISHLKCAGANLDKAFTKDKCCTPPVPSEL